MRDPLTADQEELFELLLREEGILDEPAEPPDPSASTDASAPRQGLSPTQQGLSPTQQGLWLVEQIAESATSAYNITASFLLDGALRPGALDSCCREVLRRHPVLRTRIELHGDVPLVAVDAMDRRRVVPLIDLSALGEEIGHGVAERLARAAAARAPDLAREWAFRASLLRLAERRHVLLLAVHHMVADGRSFHLVLRELALLYQAQHTARDARLTPTEPLYRRLETHQRYRFESGRIGEQLSYWRRRLAGLRLLELPTDRPRPPRPDPTGLRLLRGLDGELGRALLRLAREERVTPFMILLAAFQTLLGRLAGQDDVVVGVAADARDRLGAGEVVGLFVNTVVMRTDLSGGPSFRDLLTRVRRVTSEAFESSDLPFDRLVAELRPEREAGRNPLFQVLFAVEDDADSFDLAGLPDLEVSSFSGHSGTSKVDLFVSVTTGDPDWTVYAELSRALFDTTTVRRWLNGFEVLLRALVEDPGRGAAQLPISGAAERHQVVREWSAGRGADPDAPDRVPAHELFTRIVRRRPEALAVESGRYRWSYAHLERATARVAAHLTHLGTRPGERVAVLTERSPEMVAGLLGILRAGAVQVPLDPSHPPERLAFLLADAEARAVLVGPRLVRKLTSALPEPGCAVVRLDLAVRAPEVGSRRSEAFPPSRLDPAHPAYVIYTSGTTGRPKGTVVSHGALARLIRTAREDRVLSERGRVLQFASISFDASVLEIYPCLASGGTLVLRDEEMIATGRDFLDACRRLRITMFDLPTAFWHYLVAEMARDALDLPAALRLIIVGGEAARTRSWREWQRLVSRALVDEHVELVNAYGPTEATVISSLYRMSGRPETGSLVAIGRPIASARLFVLDPALCPVPLGAAGELVIAGAGLAWGYLGRGARTAAGFVPDPFSDRPGARLYHTGDRTRWRGDGQLLYEGRLDRQLKLRGFRVEPAEIEATLTPLPGVREAVVDAVVSDEAPTPGERRLVAWVSAHPGHELSAEKIRDALARKLPPFMIPAAFVFLESIPRTTSGKIDRRSLPAPSFEADSPAGAESGRHPLREMVTAAWAEVLGLEHVDEHGEFFALGGHSLLMIRLVARLRELFPCEIPLVDLFRHPTPAGFAAAVERRLRGESGEDGPPLIATGRLRAPLSFAQRRLWLVQQLDPDNTAFNNTGAVRLVGPLDVAALDRGLRELVRRHQVLRTTFHESEEGPVQLVGPVPSHGLARVDLSRLPAECREAAAHREILAAARRVHDLERGPLFRALLLVLGEGDVFLLSSIHHIIDDAGSEEILLRELAGLYQAFAAGREPLLDELPVQYGDYALWQEQRLRGELLDRLLTYWRDRLAGAAPAMTLPLDRPRPPVRGSVGDRELLRLPGERLEALRAFSRAEGVTLFMTILAAFETALHHATEETDVLVGTNVAGRDQPGIEGLIGFFVNMVILRTDLSGDPSFRELLVRVRETALQAWAHQELPFERLVEELCPRRDPSLTSLVQVVVNFNQPGLLSPVPEFPGLTVERFETGRFPAHFDLILDVAAGDELACSLVYSTALFEASTVRRLLSRFEFLLDLAVRDPELSLSRLRKETERAWREKLAARRGSFRKTRRSPKRMAP